jgi:type IV pilus assembly protein PilB
MKNETATIETTKHIGELLVQEKLITRHKLNRALELQQQDYAPLGKILTELEYITEEDLHSVLAKQFGFIYLNPRGFNLPDKNLIQLIPESMAREFSCFPIEKTDTSLTLAMADPWDTKVIYILSKETNLMIQPRFSRKEWILDIIDEHYRRKD